MVSKKLTKSIATLMLSVTLFGSLAPSISAMANTPSEQQIEYQLTILDNHQEDLNNLVSQMEQYSYYDGETVFFDQDERFLHHSRNIVPFGLLSYLNLLDDCLE
ncbi:hypothetical protein [Streptococcus equi]|uniref:hypothetical protein n=1 Tax=Streptococcus equi TaxID=1336 RepID=UPI001E2DF885|nr:hypothetical protein [Streptococcus equi]MCD3392046.1 hypothetical protein [Streptococcus equi subsp. zooepidemicus]